MSQISMQIGKNGVTSNFLLTLKNAFKTHKVVRISVLKNAGHTRENAEKMSQEILKNLGNNFSSRILGFTIIVIKVKNKPK